MTDTSVAQPKQAFGVGAIVGESFSIFFRNIVTVMILGFFPTLIGFVISGMLIGTDATLGEAEPQFANGLDVINFIVSILAQMATYGIAIALLVQMAYDAKLGRALSIKRYIGPAVGSVVPILVLTSLAGIFAGIGFVALIIPGLWIYAMLSVTVPAIVIDRAGFGGLGRSASLTKGYRWPIVGTLLLIIICTMLLSFAAAFVAGIILAMTGGSLFSAGLSLLTFSAINGAVYGLTGISIALIYARLREIKEGIGVDQLASVFE